MVKLIQMHSCMDGKSSLHHELLSSRAVLYCPKYGLCVLGHTPCSAGFMECNCEWYSFSCVLGFQYPSILFISFRTPKYFGNILVKLPPALTVLTVKSAGTVYS